MFRMVRRAGIPLVFVVAGGYQHAADIARINLTTLRCALRVFAREMRCWNVASDAGFPDKQVCSKEGKLPIEQKRLDCAATNRIGEARSPRQRRRNSGKNGGRRRALRWPGRRNRQDIR